MHNRTCYVVILAIIATLTYSCVARYQEDILLSKSEQERIAQEAWQDVFGSKSSPPPTTSAPEKKGELEGKPPGKVTEIPKPADKKGKPEGAIKTDKSETIPGKPETRPIKPAPAKNGAAPVRPVAAPPPEPVYPRVSLQAEGLRLNEALAMLTGNRYAVIPAYGVNLTQPVTAQVKNMPLDTALHMILTPIDYSFKIDEKDKTIDLTRFVTKLYEIPWLALERESKVEIGSETEAGGGGAGGDAGGTTTAELTGNLLIKTKSKQDLWKELGNTIGKMISTNGKVTVNKTIGLVTVEDLPSYIKRIDDFLSKFVENMKKQALIEVEVFEVQFDRRDAKGVDWNNVMTRLTNAGANVNQISIGTNLSPGLEAGPSSGVTVFNISERVEGRSSIRTKESMFQLLSTYGKVKMLSRPQLRVINNQAAYIGVGEVVPYLKSVERDISGQGGLEAIRPQMAQVRTGLTLMLMPFIQTEKKKITMEVAPLFNEIREFVEFDLGAQMKFSNPVVTTRQVVTMVEAKDNETIIMGGILVESAKRGVKQVPWLGSIPFVGNIFRGIDNQRNKVELVVSLTPRILTL